jgi:predicted amidohydrolase YtcJ
VIDPSQAPRMAELGVDVVAKPGNLVPFGRVFEDVWKGPGQEHLSVIPVRTMLEAGVRVSFGSDAPCASFNPMENMWAAVARLSSDGGSINPDEAITATQALRCYTINSAHAATRAGEEGSIEVGKRANFVVLDEDPLQCETDRIRDISVVMTLVDGLVLHEGAKAPPSSRLRERDGNGPER